MILERYVGRSFFGATLLAWLMLTFVLVVGLLVQVTNMISRGLKPAVVAEYVRLGFPETFELTVPLAVLVSALLVFGRLSADSEIAAMRACGVNLLRLMRGPALAGVLLSAFSFYILDKVIPPSHEARRVFVAKVNTESALALLEPGRFIHDFPGVVLRFERKEGNWLHDVMIITGGGTNEPVREVRAAKALVQQNGADLDIDFYRFRVDPAIAGRHGVATAETITHTVTNAFKVQTYATRDKNRGMGELVARLPATAADETAAREAWRADASDENRRALAEAGRQRRGLLYEINRRLATACAPLCFILIGIPLGIRSHRRESSAGIGVALGIAFVFYLSRLTAETAVRHGFLPAHILVWIPVAICLGVAFWLVPKNQ